MQLGPENLSIGVLVRLGLFFLVWLAWLVWLVCPFLVGLVSSLGVGLAWLF